MSFLRLHAGHCEVHPYISESYPCYLCRQRQVDRAVIQAPKERTIDQKFALVMAIIKSLDDEHFDCGCMPCYGHCWTKESMRDWLHDLRAEFKEALK